MVVCTAMKMEKLRYHSPISHFAMTVPERTKSRIWLAPALQFAKLYCPATKLCSFPQSLTPVRHLLCPIPATGAKLPLSRFAHAMCRVIACSYIIATTSTLQEFLSKMGVFGGPRTSLMATGRHTSLEPTSLIVGKLL